MYLRLSKAIALATILTTSNAISVELSENVYASGFLSVGAANYRSYDRDDNSWQRDWHQIIEGGVSISATLPYGLEFNGQALYRDFAELSDDSKLKLDYASIDWRNNLLGVGEQTISLGRVKSGGGIYNQTRDMPFIRPSVLLPHSVYTDDLRSVHSHIDGIRLASNFYISDGDLRVELAAGKPDLDDDFVAKFYSFSKHASWQDANANYFDIRYQNANWLVTYTRTSFDGDLNSPIRQLDIDDLVINTMSKLDLASSSFGLQYQHSDFEVTAEYAKQKVRTYNTELNIDFERELTGHYAQFRYFVAPELSVLLRKEKLSFDEELEFDSIAPIGLLDSQQYALGLSWRINSDWQLNVEGHRSKTELWDENLALMQLSWRF